MFKAIVLFALGLVMLIFGGDWFVDGAVGLARRLKMSELLIGATIVSIGTTLPEVMVSATGAAIGNSAIAYGNAVGSVICNTSLVAALTVAVRPGGVDKNSFRVPVLFFFMAAVFYCVIAYTGRFTAWSGIVLLLGFAAYIAMNILNAGKHPELTSEEEETEDKNWPLWKQLLFIVLGAALIAVGSRLLVNNGTEIARGLGVPESVIALSFVALGTSLPELVTAVTSLIKGHSALSLGNIVGANLFNLVLVSGMATVIRPFDVPSAKLIGGVNAAYAVDMPLMLFVMALLTIPALVKGKLYKSQGIILLLLYASYMVFQFAF